MSPIRVLLSMLVGLLPEALFFAIFLIGAKNITTKKFAFFVLIIALFLLEGMLLSYTLWYYIMIVLCIYGIMKLLYSDAVEFIDLFLISFGFLYIAVIGYICYLLGNLLTGVIQQPVLVMLIVNRFLLFIPLSALYSKLNKCYNAYKKV